MNKYNRPDLTREDPKACYGYGSKIQMTIMSALAQLEQL